MPSGGAQFRAGDEKAAHLPQLNVSLAETEYRENREKHRRQHSQNNLLHTTDPSPLPSPLSATFSREDPPRLTAAGGLTSPPYQPSSISSPTYSQSSFTPVDLPTTKQKLLPGGGDEAPRQLNSPYLSPYGAGASPGLGGGSVYNNSAEWIPMQRPLSLPGPAAASRSRRRRRMRMITFCIAPLLLLVIIAVLGFVLGYLRVGSPRG